ncbi:MAG: TonB-dependent receptor [Ignavibacteriales bacterium]|nr:MAG: TonB-dependent receptor [Ignavibacteriales bacterium]
MKNRFTVIMLILFVAVFAFVVNAQTGKVVGKVTDLETGEALIGANVIISGTNFGAATNLDGNFIILNVPPGNYTLVGKYIGYKDITQSNIVVSAGITTDINFKLPSETYITDEVVIVAKKDLINKNVTNSNTIITPEEMENLPVRGVNSVVSTQTGVVNQDGNLYVRGSRSDQVAFYVDGVLVNDPVFGGARTLGIFNAVQEIQFQAGGYSAEFGGANAGIISTTSKIGTEKYQFSFEGITDNFVQVGNKFLGTYSYGYSEYAFTAGGPITPEYKNLRFFIAGNNVYNRTPVNWYRGANFPGLYDPDRKAAYDLAVASGSSNPGTVDTIDFIYPAGYLLNSGQNTYNLQGNLYWDLNPFTIRLNGSFRYTEGRNGRVLLTHRTSDRAGYNEGQTITSSLKITQVLSDKAFYDVIFNYFDDYNVNMDPIFKHNVAAYGDSVENAKVGTTLRSDGQFPTSIVIYGNSFTRSVVPFNNYTKNRSRNMGGTLNLLYQIGQHHELKTGGDFKYFTIRRYSVAPVSTVNLARSQPEAEYYDLYNRPDNYGYDEVGNLIDSGINGPKHPVFAGYYIQDKMEFSDLIVNFGLRLDYIDTDGQRFKDPSKIKFLEGDVLDPDGLEDVPVFSQISPRLGFSFPVTDKTVFHAQYGKFVQQSRLRDIYQGYNLVADNIKGGFAIQNPVGFGLTPERTTQYEIGFKQQIGEIFAFDLTGFYKDIKDQIQIRSVFADPSANHRQYYAFVNGDFATVKGIEFKFDLRRTERISATFDYTYSDAQGTGSNPSSSFRQIWQSPTSTPFFPQQIAPLDFNRAHSGFVNFDYRFASDDGPTLFGAKILENFGANLLISFTSGFNYTRWDDDSYGNRRNPTEPLNSSTTPFSFQLDAKVDKSFNIGPLEANVYLWVINLLNTQNAEAVFNVTGDPYDDGYLSSPQGSLLVQSYRTKFGEEVANQYQDIYRTLTYDATSFGPPRQVRLGVRLNY